MFYALGYCQTEFDPARPGRLCRGRERWIEPFELEGGPHTMHRLTLSGAAFADDSAADALRGVSHSKVQLAAVIRALFPRKKLLAFMEDGHPADIPERAEGIEAYDGYRAAGRTELGLVRWHMEIRAKDVAEVLLAEPYNEHVRGFAVLDGNEDTDKLYAAVFLLTGMSTLDSPPAQYQPSALPELLEQVPAVILLHRDKHGTALGVYSRAPIALDGALETLCAEAESLRVPFAIPPMLARWDRALAELRTEWEATR